MAEQNEKRARRRRLELAVLIPNVILIGIIALYFAVTKISSEEVAPLVPADQQTSRRISQLELALQRDPGNFANALELSRLYRDAGEFPWSYDALRNAEREGGHAPDWRLKLGLAYLDLGKNDDALRVLKAARKSCTEKSCQSHVEVKLDLFTRLSELFIERGIDSRRHQSAAEKALRELVRPMTVDPQKMRPKAPATPPEGQGAAGVPGAAGGPEAPAAPGAKGAPAGAGAATPAAPATVIPARPD